MVTSRKKKQQLYFNVAHFLRHIVENKFKHPLNVHKTHSRYKFQWHISYLVSRWTQLFTRWLNSDIYTCIYVQFENLKRIWQLYKVTDRYDKGYAKGYMSYRNSKRRPNRKIPSSHIHQWTLTVSVIWILLKR